VHRHRGVVVDPDDVLALVVDAQLGHESTGRRGALRRGDRRQRPFADARHRFVAARCAQQHGRAGAQACRAVEQPQRRLLLVDDDEGRTAMVSGGDDLAQGGFHLARGLRRGSCTDGSRGSGPQRRHRGLSG
jgi:hypothetical protein